ncbi:disease resistance protein RGA2-like [Carex rostrata]
MELLQRRLREILSGKRYVLVLDDVWNDNVNEWERLRALINCGDSGSVVIVTTRNDRVAQIMGTMESYNLGCLGEEDSWSMFQKRAFSKGVKEHPELVEIGRKLVQNCGGLPLAIKALGSLMSYKHEVYEWLAILEQSTIWENKHANDEVLPVLRLSYDHLPSYMKQCFAFCAVFPKDYVMEKEKLVQLWMAHGFIPSDGPGDLEMTGSNIFNELAWRSFFQNIEQVFCDPFRRGHGYRSRTTCKMHDLMHDLAQLIMRDECLSLHETSQINDKPQCKVRHIFLGFFSMKINDVFESFPSTRSLVSFRQGSSRQRGGILKFNFLRVLDLFIIYIDKGMVTFPRGKMKHLRFLDLSLNIYTLPEAITTLYLLQTLRLNTPSKLPEGMRYMTSLRHLYIKSCSELKCMPPGLGELKYLQTLTCYIVGIGIGNGIGELRTLNLGGQLEVYNLREVKDARDAREANLISKQNLDHLALCWGMPINNQYGYSDYLEDQYEYSDNYSEDQYEYSDYSEVESNNSSEVVDVDPFEVLEALKPCNKLKVLRLEEYNGDKFSIWMTEYQMLENLVELYIIECTRCTNGLPLHRLPLLQILQLKFMDNLRHLCCGVFMSAEGGEDAPITFPSLKLLILLEMPNLQFWCEGDVGEKTSLIFPVLRKLSIIDCPKLSAMPVTPLLEEMTIIRNKILSCFATGLTGPCFLTLDSRDGGENNADETLSFKPWESPSLKPWVSLEILTIKGFNHIIPPMDGRECEKLSVDVNATALRYLHIKSSNFWFSSIPSNSPLWLWKCFTFLEDLKVEDCDSLSYWPEEELSNLINLRYMYVCSCINFLGTFSELPSEMTTRQVVLPKLEYLEFLNCPNMVEVPQLPKSLENLIISGSTKLECLPEWLGSLVALKELSISCESVNSLPSSIGCLIALKSLWIDGCFNLESLPEGMQGLEALKTLRFTTCPKIRILPEGLLQRLRSLDCLKISGCPLLQRDFQKHSKYWHLISEIPDLKIEEGGRSSKIGDLTRLISSCKIPCLSGQS